MIQVCYSSCMTRFWRARPLVPGVAAAACGGTSLSHTSDQTGRNVASAECASIPARARGKLPRVVLDGPKAQALLVLISDALAAQKPRITKSSTAVFASLACSAVSVPGASSGYGCTGEMKGDPGLPVSLSPPSKLAADLFTALADAGTSVCVDPHGQRVQLQNVVASFKASHIEFDDASMYSVLPELDVVVSGEPAAALLDAFAAADIDDCATDSTVFLVCNRFRGAPSCGYSRSSLVVVYGSVLRPACLGGVSHPGGELSPEASETVWQAVLNAARAAGYQPRRGTLDQATVINAKFFTWDGNHLQFELTVDSVTLPPDRPPPP